MQRPYVQQKQMYLNEDTSAFKVTEGGPDVCNWIYAVAVYRTAIILKRGG